MEIKNIKIFNSIIENFVLLKKEILKKYQNFNKKCNEIIINVFNDKKNQKKNKNLNENENNFNENNLSNNLKHFLNYFQQFLTSKEKEINFFNKIINEKKFFDISKISNAIEKLNNDKKNYENNFKNLEKIKLKYNEYFFKFEKVLKEEFETKKFFSIEKNEKNIVFINEIINDYKNLIIQIKQNKKFYFESLNNYLNSIKNFYEYENNFFQEIFKNLIEFNELHLLHNFFNFYSNDNENNNNNENFDENLKIDENINKIVYYEEYIPNLVKNNKDLNNYYNNEINDNNIKDNDINNINNNENNKEINNNENNINENNNNENNINENNINENNINEENDEPLRQSELNQNVQSDNENENKNNENQIEIPEVQDASLQSEINNFNEIVSNIKKFYEKQPDEVNKFSDYFQDILKSKIDYINDMINKSTPKYLYALNVYQSKLDIYSFLNQKVQSILKELSTLNKFNNSNLIIDSLVKIEEYRSESEKNINSIVNQMNKGITELNTNRKNDNIELSKQVKNITNELNKLKKKNKEYEM